MRLISYLNETMLLETFTQENVKKWKSDAQNFTKDIRRIKNGKELYDVWKAFKIWREWLEETVFESILGSNISGLKHPLDNDELRKNVWQLVITSEIFEPTDLKRKERNGAYEKRDGRFLEFHYFNDYVTKPYNGNENVWQAFYEKWDETRNSKYAKLSRLIKNAFKSLEELFNRTDSILELYQITTETIDGVKFIKRFIENSPSQQRRINSIINGARKAIKIIRKNGLGKILSNFNLIVDVVRDGAGVKGAGGWYNYYTDKTAIAFVSNEIETTLHEIGHRYYYQVLSRQARNEWNDFLKGLMSGFNNYEQELILRTISDEMDKLKEKGENSGGKQLFTNASNRILKLNIADKWKTYINRPKVRIARLTWFENKETFEEYKKKVLDYYKNRLSEPFMTKHLTDYTNTWIGTDDLGTEGFAETFMLYNIRPNVIPEEIREKFKEIIGIK